jgi:gamma-glutamylcyclotransferase (GGCT)/AIG2-like uncharacterized protein YtfP
MKLFVYGSLKPGGWSHYLLENEVSNPEDGWIVGAEIYDVGSFPALNLESALGTDKTVFGIVYDINRGSEERLFRQLDSLEGYPRLFDRDDIMVETNSGPVKAVVYFGKATHLFDNPVVESGVWDAV